MGISRVTRNCQITIPKDIRKIVGIKEGDEIVISVIDGKAVLSKSGRDFAKEAAGIWAGMKETGVEYENKIRKGWSKRLKREYATH